MGKFYFWTGQPVNDSTRRRSRWIIVIKGEKFGGIWNNEELEIDAYWWRGWCRSTTHRRGAFFVFVYLALWVCTTWSTLTCRASESVVIISSFQVCATNSLIAKSLRSWTAILEYIRCRYLQQEDALQDSAARASLGWKLYLYEIPSERFDFLIVEWSNFLEKSRGHILSWSR